MQSLMMDFQLTLNAIMRRAEMLFRNQEIVTRQPDKSYHRYTYGDWIKRTKKLALALRRLGVKDGERVATFCWNITSTMSCIMVFRLWERFCIR